MSRGYEDFTSEREKVRRVNEELRFLSGKTNFEKEDERALIVAAMTTIFPVVLIGCLLFYLVVALIFRV